VPIILDRNQLEANLFFYVTTQLAQPYFGSLHHHTYTHSLKESSNQHASACISSPSPAREAVVSMADSNLLRGQYDHILGHNV